MDENAFIFFPQRTDLLLNIYCYFIYTKEKTQNVLLLLPLSELGDERRHGGPDPGADRLRPAGGPAAVRGAAASGDWRHAQTPGAGVAVWPDARPPADPPGCGWRWVTRILYVYIYIYLYTVCVLQFFGVFWPQVFWSSWRFCSKMKMPQSGSKPVNCSTWSVATTSAGTTILQYSGVVLVKYSGCEGFFFSETSSQQSTKQISFSFFFLHY